MNISKQIMSQSNRKRLKRGIERQLRDSINIVFEESVNLVEVNQQLPDNVSREEQHDDTQHEPFIQVSPGNDLLETFSEISGSSDHLEANRTDIKSETTCALTSASIRESLRNWSLRHGVTLSATTDLLKILQPHSFFSTLPLDARALLETPRYSRVKEIPPGSYINFDWKHRVTGFTQKYPDKVAVLQVNIDGIPIFKSSSRCFWPILGCLQHSTEVFCIGLWIGKGKPQSVNQFLADFVADFKDLHIKLGSEKVKIGAFVCDAPARSYITGIKNHTGYYGCAKCTTKGKYVDNRVVFPQIDAAPRTDSGFRSCDQASHQNEQTLLLKLPMDMAEDAPYEYMHLVALGVTRKLLYIWISMKKSPARLPRNLIEKLNKRLQQVSKYTPCEFSRKPRSVLELDHWKATELRQFLIYSGPVVLKDILPLDQYQNFICLSVAIRLLLGQNTHKTYNDYAHSLLVHFVKCFGMLYGEKYMSYNIHGLVHVASDAIKHGPLDSYSGFKFENHLQKIKCMVRSPFQALQQVHNRIAELEKQQPADRPTGFSKRRESELDSESSETHFSVFTSETAKYKLTKGNNCVLLKSGEIGLIESFIKCGEHYILFKEFSLLANYFDNPCGSKFVNICEVSKLKSPVRRSVKEIDSKVYLVPIEEKIIAIPLVHCE